MSFEKFHEIKEMISELEEKKLMTCIEEFLNDNPAEAEAQEIISACQHGMDLVGEYFQTGEYFVGDLIFAGELITDVIKKLKPLIETENFKSKGVILLGTVFGDLHDVGKNIFKTMSEAAGFKVIDIGIDQPSDIFVKKTMEINPDIIGMSGVLTLSLESMKNTVEDLKNAGLRDNIKIIIGGNPVTKETCRYIGADAFTVNALLGVKICKEWMENSRH